MTPEDLAETLKILVQGGDPARAGFSTGGLEHRETQAEIATAAIAAK